MNGREREDSVLTLFGLPTSLLCLFVCQEPFCQQLVEQAVSLLKQQNSLLATHPNSHIYSQLRSLVDFDGFYLESEPCLVCNDPEIQSSVSGCGQWAWSWG